MTEVRSPIYQLGDFVRAATKQYRKGEAVTEEHGEGVDVVHVYAMPHVDEADTVTVDVGFIQVGFTETAAAREEFLRLLKAALAEPGEFAEITPLHFVEGPSYIEVGAWIGDQGLALCLFALLKHYGLASIVTPEVFGITGAEADQMMGVGFVMFAPSKELFEELGVA